MVNFESFIANIFEMVQDSDCLLLHANMKFCIPFQ